MAASIVLAAVLPTGLAGLSGAASPLLLLAAVALTLALLGAAAYRWPLATMVLYLLAGPSAALLQMTPVGRPLDGVSLLGINPASAVLFALMGATAWRGLVLAYERRSALPPTLRWTAAAFAAWLLVEIVRNLAVYGVSTVGEFRSSYLILAVPAYVAVFFTKQKERRALLKLTAVVSTVVVIGAAPFVAVLKGWGVGAGSRFFPSALSLGLLLGWLALYFAARSNALKVASAVVWLVAIPVGALVVVDGHRSVWLVALAVLPALLLFGEVDLLRLPGWILPAGAAVALAVLLLVAVGHNPAPFVLARAAAFTAPDRDGTASWRQTQWEAQLTVWREQPVVGQGFGGYWQEARQYGAAGVAPHSLYVQILVKLGIIGLVLWILVAVNVALCLGRALVRLRREGRRRDLDYVLVLMGLVALVAVHVYGIAYGLDYYTPVFIGLGVAAAAYAGSAAPPSRGGPLRQDTVLGASPQAAEALPGREPLRPVDGSRLDWSD